jgi:hypothetical protein
MTSETKIADNPLVEYATDAELAQLRGVTARTLRAERQRGDGPPWVRDGRKIYYHIPSYRNWLMARLRQPVRGPMAKCAA